MGHGGNAPRQTAGAPRRIRRTCKIFDRVVLLDGLFKLLVIVRDLKDSVRIGIRSYFALYVVGKTGIPATGRVVTLPIYHETTAGRR